MKISVCLCTYKRPHVKDTVDSILKLDVPNNISLEIVVVDDDKLGSGKNYLCDDIKNKKIEYFVSGSSNVAVARNLALEKATGDWIFFLDDDEVVDKRAIIEMVDLIEKKSADAIIGKVFSIYPEEAPEWIVKGNYFNREYKETGKELDSGGCGCTFVSKKIIKENQIEFDIEYGNTGGEDSDFIHRLNKCGAKIVFSNEIFAEERVESNRLNAKYLLDRSYRVGQTYTRYRTKNKSKLYKFEYFLKELVKLFISLGMCAFFKMFDEIKMFKWKMKVADVKGKISVLIGKESKKMYG